MEDAGYVGQLCQTNTVVRQVVTPVLAHQVDIAALNKQFDGLQ